MFGKCVLRSRGRPGIFVAIIWFTLVSGWTIGGLAAQLAVVVTDSAIVYQKANFDSKILGYLRAGRKMKVSSKKFNSAFYRVRLKQGTLGYISDVDVSAASDKTTAPTTKEAAAPPKRPKHVLETTYLGVVLGLTSFAEIINKQEFKDTEYLTYGGKLTFPFHAFDGAFFMDVNLIGSFSTPKYYQLLSQSPATGYVLMTSVVLNFSIFDFSERRGLFYLGGGPLLSYSSFLVEVSGSKIQTDELRAGGIFQVGLAFNLGGAVFKLEPKFYVEKASYNGVDIGFQFALN